MAGESAFLVEGVVTAALPNGTYRVALANGHDVLAFVTRRLKKTLAALRPGESVRLQMSPYDLSQGRIVVGTKQI